MALKQFLLISLAACLILTALAEYKVIEEKKPKMDKFANHFSHENFTTSGNGSQRLNIHLIPHSHDDVGWLKTVDQYYYGSRNDIQFAGVQYTIDTIVEELVNDPSKTFVYVEIAFFSRWWNEQNEEKKATVRKLVSNGQLEFLNAGWCMNDEAAPYYEDVIDQMTIGHKFVKEEFGVIPKIGWHIDPFGHSSAQAAMFSQMGFDAFFFARIDDQDKDLRLKTNNMELIWNPYQAGGQSNAIFTSVNYYHYEAPPGFCFDVVCRDEPIKDDPTLEDYNVDKRANDFVNYFKNMALHFKHNTDIMHTMGSDFQYSNARMYFKNVDKLIKYINAHPDFGVNVFYSTPSKYIEKINKAKEVYQEKNDDFWPYADNDNGYWTGYFVSRIAIKGYVRDAGRLLQSARTLHALLSLSNAGVSSVKSDELAGAITQLEETMGILQHHDAVAGTEKQAVANDYVFILNNAEKRVLKALDAVTHDKNVDLINESLEYYHCHWNATNAECPDTTNALLDGKSILLTIYNPTVTRDLTIRVRVPTATLSVIDSQNRAVVSDVICSETESQECDLFFYANLDGFSFNYFKISMGIQSLKLEAKKAVDAWSPSKTFKIDEERKITVHYDKQNFLLNVCNNEKNSCKDYQFKVSYEYYQSYQGDGQKSGAYIFRPNENTLSGSIPYSTPVKTIIHQGSVITQITVIADRTTTRLRFFNDKVLRNGCEIETFVDSIPILDDQGKEIVMKVSSPQIASGNTFYTDSQGLDLQKRVLNFRPTWNLAVHQPASGNYYPINGMIAIKDESSGEMMTLLNDRSQGGASLNSGEVEIMIHRRLLRDDDRGVGEPLNETDNDGKGLRQRLRHYLLFSSSEDDARRVQVYIDLRPIVSLAGTYLDKFLQSPEPAQRLINSVIEIPEDTKLYLKKLSDNKFLLRVQNMNPSSEVAVEIPYELTELSMSANQPLSAMKQNRLKWSGEKSGEAAFTEEKQKNYLEFKDKTAKLNLLPLQLRTFEFSQHRSEQLISA